MEMTEQCTAILPIDCVTESLSVPRALLVLGSTAEASEEAGADRKGIQDVKLQYCKVISQPNFHFTAWHGTLYYL